MPDKSTEIPTKHWHITKQGEGGIFAHSVRQELDVSDEDLLRYMRKLDRGIPRPEKTTFKSRNFSVAGTED